MTIVLAWRTHGSCGAAFFPGVRSELFVYAWLHEVKFDGYRVQVHKLGSRVVIYSSTAAMGATSPSVSLPSRSCCTSCQSKLPCSTVRLWLAMPMDVRTSPGCTCDGPGRELSSFGHLTYLRSTAAIFVCSRW